MSHLTRTLLLSSLALSLLACQNYSLLGKSNAVGRPAGWSELSHGNATAPDYGRVFPQDTVKRIEIKIAAQDWKLMQDNMSELFGSGASGPGGGFGGGGMGGPGGNFTPPAGFTPPDGFVPPGFPTPSPATSGAASPSASPSGTASAAPGASPTPRPTPAGGFAGMRPGGGGGGGALEFSEEDPIYRPATITFEGQTWNYVGIRYKGNSSLRASWGRTLKMPFRFDFDEFESEYPEIKNQRFFGFKRLTFSSGFSDNSLIREKMAADIFRKAGLPSAQTAFYRVYLDYGSGSKYLGLYTMVEAPDTPMLAAQFKNATGNLYKPSGNGAKFVTFDQKSFPKKSNETTSNWQDIQNVFSALHASRSNPEQWRTGLEKVFDVEGFLKWLATNTLIQSWDTYGRMAHNYYLYNDPSDGLIHWIPWDNNMALSGSGRPDGAMMPGAPAPGTPAGTTPNPNASATLSTTPNPNRTPPPGFQGPGAGGAGGPGGGGFGGGGMGGPGGAFSLDLTSQEVNESWPLIRYLIDDPVYHAKYVAYVDQARKEAFAIEPTKAMYQKAHSLIRPYVVGTDGEQSDSTLLSSPQAFETALDGLNTHLQARHAAAEAFLAK